MQHNLDAFCYGWLRKFLGKESGGVEFLDFAIATQLNVTLLVAYRFPPDESI